MSRTHKGLGEGLVLWRTGRNEHSWVGFGFHLQNYGKGSGPILGGLWVSSAEVWGRLWSHTGWALVSSAQVWGGLWSHTGWALVSSAEMWGRLWSHTGKAEGYERPQEHPGCSCFGILGVEPCPDPWQHLYLALSQQQQQSGRAWAADVGRSDGLPEFPPDSPQCPARQGLSLGQAPQTLPGHIWGPCLNLQGTQSALQHQQPSLDLTQPVAAMQNFFPTGQVPAYWVLSTASVSDWNSSVSQFCRNPAQNWGVAWFWFSLVFFW